MLGHVLSNWQNEARQYVGNQGKLLVAKSLIFLKEIPQASIMGSDDAMQQSFVVKVIYTTVNLHIVKVIYSAYSYSETFIIASGS